jgi:hypothetical protein
MASVGNLTALFSLMNRKMIHRSSFRFGLFIGYGFVVMLLRLLANAWTVFTVMRSHPDYDFSGFFRSSIILLSFYGLCLVPLLGARTANGILEHPRLAGQKPWRLASAHALFTLSRLPFIGVLCVFALHCAGLAAASGKVSAALATFFISTTIFASGNAAFHRVFRHLNIRLAEAELALLAGVALAVFANPQPSFRNGIVALPLPLFGMDSLSAPGAGSEFASIAIAQCAFLAFDMAFLAAMRCFAVLENFVRRRTISQVFAKIVFGRLSLSLPFAAAFAVWYILAWPGGAWMKFASVAGISLYAIIREAAAFSKAGEEVFRLFRRRPGMRDFLPPALFCLASLAAPFLLRAAQGG